MLQMESQSSTKHSTSLTNVKFIAALENEGVNNKKGEAIQVPFYRENFGSLPVINVTCGCYKGITATAAAFSVLGDPSKSVTIIIAKDFGCL